VINLRRGAFRVWLVLSAFYVVVVLAFGVMSGLNATVESIRSAEQPFLRWRADNLPILRCVYAYPARQDCPPRLESDPEVQSALTAQYYREQWLNHLLVAALPVLSVYLLGRLLWWVALGFRHDR